MQLILEDFDMDETEMQINQILLHEDESPIDISKIIDFLYKFDIDPYRIRQSVNHLSWKIQMGQVIRETCN